MSKADQSNPITSYAGIFRIRTILSLLVMVTGIIGYLTIFPKLALAKTPSQIFEDVKESVMVVKTYDLQGNLKAQGSGVMISSDRVATNCHVVENGDSYRVGQGDTLRSATIYAEDADKDICILEVKGIKGKAVQFGKASSLKVGDAVVAIGAPRGLELSLSDGIVAQLRGAPPPLIQTTAPISPGSSGGGLFDEEGRLVGLTTLYIEGGQSLNFAMPAEWIKEVKTISKPTVRNEVRQTEWIKRTVALEHLKDWQGLVSWGHRWAMAEPKNCFAWLGLAEAYRNLNHYDDAILAYRKALSVESGYAPIWINLGVTYSNAKRYEDAIDAYRHSLMIDPTYANTWYNLGQSYYFTGRNDEAIAAFHEAIKLNPLYADAWNNLAAVYYLSGNTAATLKAIQELRRIDPTRAEQLFNLIVPH